MPKTTLLSALLLLGACATAPPAPSVSVWGSMREALREGHSQGRIALADAAAPDVIGVGALAGLAGEVTIVDGRALIATASDGECTVRAAPAGTAATLLVAAEVPRWVTVPLPDCATYADLEAAIAARLAEAGFDARTPTPIRVRGAGREVAYHVIAGSCPIANPSGPSPWRHQGPIDRVELVGVFADGAAGKLTHHDRRSHLHVVAEGHMGHLDEIAMTEVVLLLPAP